MKMLSELPGVSTVQKRLQSLLKPSTAAVRFSTTYEYQAEPKLTQSVFDAPWEASVANPDYQQLYLQPNTVELSSDTSG